jgi:magnesium transporter
VITCQLYRDGQLQRAPFDPAKVSEVLADPASDVRVWLDAEDPGPEEFELLATEFGLHELSIEDMRHRDQRPKVEVFPGYSFVVIRPLRFEGKAEPGEQSEIVEQELHVIMGERFLVTLRYAPAMDLTEVLSRWERRESASEEGPGFLLYVLLDEVVDGYLSIVDDFEDEADVLEDLVFETPTPESLLAMQQRLVRLKHNVVRFRRQVTPLRRVVDFFQERPEVVTGPLAPYYRDVADHVVRAVELVDNVRDLLTSLLDIRVAQQANRLAEQANQMNGIMKKLTSWAGIILVPTLIAGIYGMNFRSMPELRWSFGYPFALTTMALSSLILYVVFKKRDWL